MTADQVTHHLDALAIAFDAVAPYATPEVPFAADLQPAARHVAIDGSRNLIAAGLHHEAIFWIVATFSRILTAFDLNHRTTEFDAYDAAFRNLTADLGISSFDDIERRRDETLRSLPEIDTVAEAIIEAGISGGPISMESEPRS